MPEPRNIMIFAAGFGTRMKPLTNTRPKPLIEVAGRSLIDHALDVARPLDLPITVNAHYKADQIKDHLADQNIRVIEETPDILDTGGGLKNAALPGPVVTLNPDAIWHGPNPLELLRAAWREDMEALLLLIPHDQTVGYTRGGNFAMDAQGRLTPDPSGLIYTGAQITRTDRIDDHPKRVFSLVEAWQAMVEDDTLFGTTYPGKWADVGTPEGIELAEQMLHV